MDKKTREWDLVVELNNLREMNIEKQNIIDQLREEIAGLKSGCCGGSCRCSRVSNYYDPGDMLEDM